MLVTVSVTPLAASPASICASGLSVTCVDDSGADEVALADAVEVADEAEDVVSAMPVAAEASGDVDCRLDCGRPAALLFVTAETDMRDSRGV
jgi:hypothetical protein